MVNLVMLDETTVRIYGKDIGNAIEVRGNVPYGVVHKPDDPLHAFLDMCDPATVALLMSGDDLHINPKNSRREPTLEAIEKIKEGCK